ncbi:MAG: Ig-like domain-containing protein [Sedimentisphaerales bacterium]|nr:Ig-like domain-containing protein [Sedimentisphaerales bacterium]
MGLRSWVRRILKRKDASVTHAPIFELLERRVLLSDISGLQYGLPSSYYIAATIQPQGNPTARDDMYSCVEDQARLVAAPGLLANDTYTGDVKIVLLEGPSYGNLTVQKDGSFIYVPKQDWWGHDSFTYRLVSAGSVSDPARVFLPVAPRNDPPSFSPGQDLVVPQDAGMCQYQGWATSISPGPADEAYQTVRFLVSTDRPELFELAPTISSDGTLSFKPAQGACGKATVTVQLRDDGGIDNGGTDVSEPVTFTITIGSDQPLATTAQVSQLWLPSIRQGQVDNDGVLITQLLASGLLGSPDGTGPRGMAVVYADWTLGRWEYSTNGKVWEPFFRTSEGTPILLLADSRTRIRFVPHPDYKGTIVKGLVFRTWDGRNADNGAIRFVEAVGETHLGTGRVQVGIVVNPVIRLEPNRNGNAITIYRRADKIQARSSTNALLLDLPLDCFEELIVVGAKKTKDQVTVDMGIGGSFGIRDGLIVEANDRSDLVILRGTATDDVFEIRSSLILLNGLAFRSTGLEQIQLEGAGGDDLYRIYGLGIRTTIYDQAGRDTLDFFYALSSVKIDIGKSNGQWQKVFTSGSPLALRGTFEDVVGTAWSDIIYGNAADNRIWGWCGSDTIYGGGGNDWLYGQAGSDKLFGQRGCDILLGEDGDDYLDGGSGNDLVIGGLGQDVLAGSSGQDVLIGGTTAYDQDQQALRAIIGILSSKLWSNKNARMLTSGPYVLVWEITVWQDTSGDVFKTDRQDIRFGN